MLWVYWGNRNSVMAPKMNGRTFPSGWLAHNPILLDCFRLQPYFLITWAAQKGEPFDLLSIFKCSKVFVNNCVIQSLAAMQCFNNYLNYLSIYLKIPFVIFSSSSVKNRRWALKHLLAFLIRGRGIWPSRFYPILHADFGLFSSYPLIGQVLSS